MRRLVRFVPLWLPLALFTVGCGDSVEEGVRKDVDLTKEYAPAVSADMTSTMSPKAAAEAQAKAKEAAAEAAKKE